MEDDERGRSGCHDDTWGMMQGMLLQVNDGQIQDGEDSLEGYRDLSNQAILNMYKT